jgi:hypothetical protein
MNKKAELTNFEHRIVVMLAFIFGAGIVAVSVMIILGAIK